MSDRSLMSRGYHLFREIQALLHDNYHTYSMSLGNILA